MARPKPQARSSQVSQPAARVLTLHTQLEKRLHAAVCSYGNNYELGQLAGVSADVLSRFSRKERNLRLDTAGRLAKVLGLTLTDTQ